MKSLLLRPPLFKIIDFLIENKGLDLTKKEIIDGVNISRAALFKYWNELERYNLVRITRKFGKTRLYTLNSENPIVRKILDLEKVLIAQSLEKASQKELIAR